MQAKPTLEVGYGTHTRIHAHTHIRKTGKFDRGSESGCRREVVPLVAGGGERDLSDDIGKRTERRRG